MATQVHGFGADGSLSPGAAIALSEWAGFPPEDIDQAVANYLTLNPPAGVVDATAGTKGVIRLTGDLGGTAASPTVPGLADKVDKGSLVVNLQDYGATGDGTTDDTAAIRAAVAAGLAAGKTSFAGRPGATYKVTVADSTSLFDLTGTAGVTVDLSGCVIDNSATSYTADTITPIFLLDGSTDTTILVGEYIGYTLPTPYVHLGYRGATLVYAINGANGVTVDARVTNLRYGFLAGSYSSPSMGGCSNVTLRLRSSFCGYPLAAYLTEGITYEIDADDSHRPVYLAGCSNVTGRARWSNLYIAPVATLITDALTTGTDSAAQADPGGSPTASRGCSNIDVSSIDKGSPITHNASGVVQDVWCAGISLSRVDPVTFSNIKIRARTVGDDSTSTRVQGFMVTSTAKAVWSRYPHNWTSSVLIEGLFVEVNVDKSGSTVATTSSGAGPLNIRTHDVTTPTQSATVRGLTITGSIRKGSGTMHAQYVQIRGIASPATIRDLFAPDAYLLIEGNATVPVCIERSTMATLDSSTVPTVIELSTGTLITSNALPTGAPPYIVTGGRIGGAGPILRTIETRVTLSGSSVTWTDAIPANAQVLNVQTRVSTEIGGASGYQVGVAGALTRYADKTGVVVNTRTGMADSTETGPRNYPSPTSLVITAKSADFTAGAIRIAITYVEFADLIA